MSISFVKWHKHKDLEAIADYIHNKLAEELAHYILHQEHFKDTATFEDAYNFYIKIRQKSEMMMELNAKHLAAAILLPRGDLTRRATKCYKDNRETLLGLLKDDCDEIISTIASLLRDVYQVPEGVIAYRLKSKVIGFKDFLKKDIKEDCK
ncbi:MAG: ImmA/IrrE family metallo-endopeptidase [Candidatus Omnitrophica bacterium]|nr:ImmA/IrrE family metallo-endopeptidase [Candidatus Omnitrophota bacterium]MBU4589313.1 ImmA/IrrE family metallo-endopeptidase [Candidatus Omnitrophota bacterium]